MTPLPPSFALVLAALLASPLALAHTPGGMPKNYCESSFDVAQHEYVNDGAAGLALLNVDLAPPRAMGPYHDGNLIGDCDGTGTLLQFDGHKEHGVSGLALLVTTPTGPGTFNACWNEDAHHDEYPIVGVNDDALGFLTPFAVLVDSFSVTSGSCGDGVLDSFVLCLGACLVPIPPGLDGAYHVKVAGGAGHVCSPYPPPLFPC